MHEAENLTSGPATKFDFSKYRSRDIVNKLAEILNIRGSLANVISTAAYLVLVLFAVFIAFWILVSDLALLEVAFLSIFILLVGIVLGVPLGLLRVVHKSLANIEGVLTILLDSSNHAALDFAAMRSGDVEIPSGKEIVTGMYEQVIMPSVEEVVSEAFGFLGKPILWMYRKTIGGAVSRLLIAARVKEDGVIDQRVSFEELNTPEVDQAVQALSDRAKPALRFIASANSIVTSIAGGLRSYAIRPLYFVFWCLLLLALSPVAIYIVVFGLPK